MKRTLPGTRLFASVLFGASASGNRLPGAKLRGAKLLGAKLLGAKLFGATLVTGTLICADALAAEPLGRLFFTPAQRSSLEAGKRIGEPRVKRAPASRGPRDLKLDGVVTRSDGESTVWVNGRALDKRPATGFSATASGSDPATASLKLGGARDTVRMRVGQRLERSTGKIAEPYESIAGRSEGTTPIGSKSKPVTSERPTPPDPELHSVQSSDD